jgi:hypothetical protein
MNAVVIEHVSVTDLPASWRVRLGADASAANTAHVTIRIEPESSDFAADAGNVTSLTDPAFGLWRDRDDFADVTAVVDALRAPRHGA